MVPDPVYIGVTDPPSGVTGLLAGAISYMLGVCALVRPGEMALPTPCADWDLGMLLGHLSDSMADLETAIRTGHLDLERPPDHVVGDPVETLRDRAAELLCAVYGYGGPGCFVAVGGLPVPAGLVACTGAVEIAVHGWDVSAARARASCGGLATTGSGPSRPCSPPGCSGWDHCWWSAAKACSPSRSMCRPRPARATASSATSAAALGNVPFVTGK